MGRFEGILPLVLFIFLQGVRGLGSLGLCHLLRRIIALGGRDGWNDGMVGGISVKHEYENLTTFKISSILEKSADCVKVLLQWRWRDLCLERRCLPCRVYSCSLNSAYIHTSAYTRIVVWQWILFIECRRRRFDGCSRGVVARRE